MDMKYLKSLSMAAGLFFTMFAMSANATTVNVRIQNLSTSTLTLVSSNVSGLPSSLPAGYDQTFPFLLSTSSSSVAVVYSNGGPKKCSFAGSHIVQVSGPVFNKSATSTGTTYALCGVTQTVKKWVSPYDYDLRFYMGD